MTCREFTDFMTDYLAGELPAAESAKFRLHLEQCPPCLGYLKSYEQTVRLNRAVFKQPDDRLPESSPEELVQAILAAGRKPS